MAKIPKRIICLVTASVIICAHVPVAHAEALPNVLEGSATLADNIMSYYALSGSAVANTEWINTLYDSYGSSFGTIYDFAENGMLTLNNDGTWQATTALETAIENAPAYQSLGLDQIFNVSSQEAAAGGGIAASGAATLAGSLGGVASTGFLPLFAGVTVSYWGGIALGTLIAHKIGLYGKVIFDGIPITSEEVSKSLPSGTSGVYSKISGINSQFLWYVDNAYMLWVDLKYSNTFALLALHPSNSYLRYYEQSLDGTIASGRSGSIYISNNVGEATFSYVSRPDATPISYQFSSKDEYEEFLDKVKNGTVVPKKKSDDMIGENGNLTGEEDQGGSYTVPDMKPQIDPGTQAGVPLTMQDWLNFANSVKNNNTQVDPLPDNARAFKDLIDSLKKTIPNPGPNPDPDPDPDPDPYHPPKPTPVPDPDYGDPNPDQPDFESETDIPDPVDTGNPWVTPDLLDKFPFCIPKDMIDMVKGFKSVDRTAPHISWNFKSPVGHVDYTFNLDLEDFEDLATLLRSLELAAFIVGLAFATRYLIGAS